MQYQYSEEIPEVPSTSTITSSSRHKGVGKGAETAIEPVVIAPIDYADTLHLQIVNTFTLGPAASSAGSRMQHLGLSTPPHTPDDTKWTAYHHPQLAQPQQRKLSFSCWPVELRRAEEEAGDSAGDRGDGGGEAYCYDIDLDTPGISPLPRECLEADCLTPTLPPGGLGEYRVTLDGAELLGRVGPGDTDQQPFTGLKSKPSNQCVSSNSTVDDVSPVTGDVWDADLDPTHCVPYSDVHMAPPTPATDDRATSSQTPLPSVKTEQLDEDPSKNSSTGKTGPPKKFKKELKRPKNGFIRFAMKFRKQVAQDHPRLDNRDISRILGVRWRRLSDEERAEYEAAFHAEMCARKADHPEWRYGGSRPHEDVAAWEPIPTRLRPRHTLKRRKIPKLTRPYQRRRAAVVSTDWVQCDRCNKWRQLPHGADMDSIPARWYCEYNWAPKNHCDAEEDQEDPEEMLLTQEMASSAKEERQGAVGGYGLSDFVSF